MSLEERVNKLHGFVKSMLLKCGAPLAVLARWDQAGTVDELATHVAFLPRDQHPAVTIKVGVQTETHVQWYVVPLELPSLFIGGPPRTDALVLHPSSTGSPCVFMQRHMKRFVMHALQPGQVWLGVGTAVPPQEECHDRQEAFVLQAGAIFRAGAHVFEVKQAPRVRKGNRWRVTPTMLACSPLVQTEHVVTSLLNSETEQCVLQCIAPPTSALMHRTFAMQYNKGGVHFSIGTTPTCTIAVPYTDVFCSGIHCMVYASNGYFWLVDNNSSLGTYCQLFPTTPGFELTKHTQPYPILVGHNGALIKMMVVVG